jgi:PAS domain S-box-containing protein
MAELNLSWGSLASDDSQLLLALIASDLRMKVINRAWERLLGYPRELLLDKPLTRLVDQSEHAAALMLVNQHLAKLSDKPIELSLRCRDGSYRCFEWTRSPAPTEQAMYISGRDVTERKKMETTDNLRRYLKAKKTGAV